MVLDSWVLGWLGYLSVEKALKVCILYIFGWWCILLFTIYQAAMCWKSKLILVIKLLLKCWQGCTILTCRDSLVCKVTFSFLSYFKKYNFYKLNPYAHFLYRMPHFLFRAFLIFVFLPRLYGMSDCIMFRYPTLIPYLLFLQDKIIITTDWFSIKYQDRYS